MHDVVAAMHMHCLIYGLRRFEHVSNTLMSLHWLRILERIQFKLAVLVHRVLHGIAPEYLGPFTRLSDVPSRPSLRSASSNYLLIPPVRRSTVGARAFTVSGPALWNRLPSDITSIDSLPVFRRHLNIIYSVIHIQALFNNYTFLSKPRSFLYCTWSR